MAKEQRNDVEGHTKINSEKIKNGAEACVKC